MPIQFNIENVPYYTQRDNKYDPYVSCFPTSLAMCMSYCLKSIKKDKTAVGCGEKMQLEDYINELIYDDETKKWMVKNQGRLGAWIWKYKRRTIYAIEEYIFNRLMNEHGFFATAKYNLDYYKICNELTLNNIPMVIGGNFKSVSSVGGHMVCLKGFNSKNFEEVIVNDPYGNALTGYKNNDGENMQYSKKFFDKGKGNFFCISIVKK